MRTYLVLLSAIALSVAGCSNSDSNPGTRSGLGNLSAGSTAGDGTAGSDFIGQSTTPPSGDTIPGGAGGSGSCPPGQICNDTAIDNTGCGYQDVSANVVTIEKPTNLLFIYDRSSSMTEQWGSSTKWQSASNAVVQALTPIQHLIVKVGAVFFPGKEDPVVCNNESTSCNPSDPLDSNPVAGCCHASSSVGDSTIGVGCYVSAIAAPDQIAFTDPATFLSQPQMPTKCQAPPISVTLIGTYFTPWEAAAVQSDDAIYDAMAAGTLFIPITMTATNPGMDAGSPSGDLPGGSTPPMQDGANELVIIFVTEGEPNCGTNVQNVLNYAQKWFNDGMKTYVLGLPGATASGTGAVGNLNDLAVAGGTMQYIDAADPMVLQQTLTDIVLENVSGGLASCDIALGQAAAAPDKLRLIVTLKDKTEAVMDRTDSRTGDVLWSLSPDNMTVTLYGNLCDQAKAGTYPNLRFDFGCATIPPAPPPDPVVLQ